MEQSIINYLKYSRCILVSHLGFRSSPQQLFTTFLLLPSISSSFLFNHSGLHVHTPTTIKKSAEKCTHTDVYTKKHIWSDSGDLSPQFMSTWCRKIHPQEDAQSQFPHKGKMTFNPHFIEIEYIQNKMYPE